MGWPILCGGDQRDATDGRQFSAVHTYNGSYPIDKNYHFYVQVYIPQTVKSNQRHSLSISVALLQELIFRKWKIKWKSNGKSSCKSRVNIRRNASVVKILNIQTDGSNFELRLVCTMKNAKFSLKNCNSWLKNYCT